MQVNELIADRAGVLARRVGGDHGQAPGLLIGEGTFFDEPVGAHLVAVVGAKHNQRVVQGAHVIQGGHHAPDQVVDHGHIAPVDGNDLGPHFPASVAQAPEAFKKLLNARFACPGFVERRLVRYIGGVVHGKVGLGDQAGRVWPPKVGPHKERPVIRASWLNWRISSMAFSAAMVS